MPMNNKMIQGMQKSYGKIKGKKIAFAVEAKQRMKKKMGKKSKNC